MSDRFILFSDLHIHPHNNDWRRVDDALKVLEWALEETKKREIDQVFFLGDFFHIRGYLYPSVVARTYKALKKFKENGITLTMLVGNHDMPHKHSTRDNCIYAFSDVAEIAEQPSIYEGENHDIFLLPYVESYDQLNWAIDQIVDSKKRKENILFAHLDIHGANFSREIISTHGIDSNSISKLFDKVYTGHYHIHQKLQGNIWYVGSPYQINFGEAGDKKGILLYEDGEFEFIENTFSPKFMTISSEEIDESIRGNYVRIVVNDSNNILEAQEKAVKFEPRHVNVKIDRGQLSEFRQLISINNDAKDVESLLREWVDKTANEAIYNRNKLLSYGLDITREIE